MLNKKTNFSVSVTCCGCVCLLRAFPGQSCHLAFALLADPLIMAGGFPYTCWAKSPSLPVYCFEVNVNPPHLCLRFYSLLSQRVEAAPSKILPFCLGSSLHAGPSRCSVVCHGFTKIPRNISFLMISFYGLVNLSLVLTSSATSRFHGRWLSLIVTDTHPASSTQVPWGRSIRSNPKNEVFWAWPLGAPVDAVPLHGCLWFSYFPGAFRFLG